MGKKPGESWKKIWEWVGFAVLALAAVGACCFAIYIHPKNSAEKTGSHTTPIATPTIEAAEPQPTEVPVPTDTPVPTPTNVPTPTPQPTSTPVPSPTPVVVDSKLVYECKAGENAYYKFYEDGTLLVTGTGRVDSLPAELKYEEGWYVEWGKGSEGYQKILDLALDYLVEREQLIGVIVEEGITELGDFALAELYILTGMSLPSTLASIGDYTFLNSYFYVDWYGNDVRIEGINLDIEIGSHAFMNTYIQQEEFQKYAECPPTPTPTPIPPTPTPTPTPDPDNPRLMHTMQVEKDVTYEFWDNGYMYIKGKGKISDKEWGFDLCSQIGKAMLSGYTPAPGENMNQKEDVAGRPFIDTIRYVVVEEGITYLGRYALAGLWEVTECWFPSTLTGIHIDSSWTSAYTVHGYYEGKKVTLTRPNKKVDFDLFFEYIKNPESAERNGIVIDWEE